ncbi:MAG: DUF4203 domain-containing protein [Microthrixaceae bacterium]
MNDIILGILAIGIGALFALRGYLTMRLVIPVWGGLVGFMLGAGVVGAFTDGGFLAGAASWVAGLVVALLFSAVAYLYYEVSVVLAMGGIGFMLGSSLMVALNVTWGWVIVLVGVAAAVALGLLAIVGELPMLLLTILTATAGASAVVGGVMLLAGSIQTSEVAELGVTGAIADSPGWWALYVVIVIVGVVAQFRALDQVRGTLREQWATDGGRELRSGAAPTARPV